MHRTLLQNLARRVITQMTALGPSFADAEPDTAPADWPPTHGPHSKMRQRARAYTPTLAEAETGRPKTRPSASCSEPATKGKHNVPGSRAKLQKHTCKRDISPTAETPRLAVLAKSWGRQQTPGSLHGGRCFQSWPHNPQEAGRPGGLFKWEYWAKGP